MPELFLRVNPNKEESKVDLKKEKPLLIVIALGQNDYNLVFKRTTFPENYKNRKDEFIISYYADFLEDICAAYPEVPILWCLGSMDATSPGSKWPFYIEKAIELAKKRHPDRVFETLFFKWHGNRLHPNIKQHEKMAEILEEKIKNMMLW